MKTEILHASQPKALERVLSLLHQGGLAAFPTDTVYGVGALAFDAKAVESIYTAKMRPVEKAIPILIGKAEDLEIVTSSLPPLAEKLASRFWPGPLTLVVPMNPALPNIVSATKTVGVRVPNHPVARALLVEAGPMAVTSANLSGQSNPRTAQDVWRQLNGRIPLILDGGEAPGGVSSTVVDCIGAEPTILRQGPISMEDIKFALA